MLGKWMLISSLFHFAIEREEVVWVSLLAILFFILYQFFKSSKNLSIVFSTLPFLENKKRSLKERFSSLPDYLFLAALALLFIALINPHVLIEREVSKEEETETMGLALFLLLDNSSSMHYKVLAKGTSNNLEEIEKMDLSKRVAKQFVAGDPKNNLTGRKGDMIGLVAFARIPHIISPLTLDHAKILEEIDKIEYNKDIKQVGTGIGYAIYKTVATIKATLHFNPQDDDSHLKPFFEIKNPLLIIVTDGINEINPEDKNNPLRGMDILRAAEFAKENGVKVYIVNIDPSFNNEKNKTSIELYSLITQFTGGKFFAVTDAKSLIDIYREIDRQEKSRIPLFVKSPEKPPHFFDTISFFPFFILSALTLIFLSVTLEAFIFKRVP